MGVTCDAMGSAAQKAYGDLMVILGSPGNHYYTGYTFDFNVK